MPVNENTSELFHQLEQFRHLCPEMRLGQIIATVGSLAEDATGHSLWEVEDEQLKAAFERFAIDLSRRGSVVS
jgi:hypothetical protein